LGRLAQKALELLNKVGDADPSVREMTLREPIPPEPVRDDIACLIESALDEINSYWKPGTLRWIRNYRPEEWKVMIGLEQEINRKATEANIKALKEALSQYRSHIFGMSEGFRKAKGTAGSLLE